MKAVFLTLAVSLVASLANAQAQAQPVSASSAVAHSRAEFCADAKNPSYAQTLLKNPDNQLAFTNYGGLGGGGVCWWHSMFTRNAALYAVFRPELPKGAGAVYAKIIRAIGDGKGVVEIPGYANLREFSEAFAQPIEKYLEQWQINDGVFGFGWMKGLQGGSSKQAEQLRATMDDTYEQVVVRKRVIYQMLQLPGVSSHAWLVVNMARTQQGYLLEVVDSNFIGTQVHTYVDGDTQLYYFNGQPFVPNTQREIKDATVTKIRGAYCK